MNIEITRRHVNVKPESEAYALQKVERIAKFLKQSARLEIVIDHERDNFLVECIVSGYRGPVIVSHVLHPDPRAAIDLMVDKMEQQLRKHKGRRKDHHGESMAGPEPRVGGAAEPDEVSYEDVIDEELNH